MPFWSAIVCASSRLMPWERASLKMCVWASTKPGMSVNPFRSITSVSGSRRARTSSFAPTATIFVSWTAIAWACVKPSSMVRITPLKKIMDPVSCVCGSFVCVSIVEAHAIRNMLRKIPAKINRMRWILSFEYTRSFSDIWQILPAHHFKHNVRIKNGDRFGLRDLFSCFPIHYLSFRCSPQAVKNSARRDGSSA